MRVQLSARSYVDHFPAWLDAASSAALMDRLCTDLAFEQHSVRLFGKEVPQPRLIAWCGSLPYTYSGLTLAPKELPDCLVEILTGVTQTAQVPFNHLLLNLYRNGVDSMGYHADNERELGVDPVVATLSLGTTRRFVVKARRGTQTLPLDVANGDLIVMGGACQREFVHGVPKQPRLVASRLSITFRRIVADQCGTLVKT